MSLFSALFHKSPAVSTNPSTNSSSQQASNDAGFTPAPAPDARLSHSSDPMSAAAPGRSWSQAAQQTLSCVSRVTQTSLRGAGQAAVLGTKRTMGALTLGQAVLVTAGQAASMSFDAGSQYLYGLTPEEPKELRRLGQQMEAFSTSCGAMANITDLRGEVSKGHISYLQHISPVLGQLPEVAQGLKSAKKELAFEQKVQKTLLEVSQGSAQKLAKLEQAPTKANANATADFLGKAPSLVQTLNLIVDKDKTVHSQERAQNQDLVEHCATLLQARAKSKQLASFLHLDTRWSDWSAYFQEMADYCIQTQKPELTFVADQAQAQTALVDSLSTLTDLSESFSIAQLLSNELKAEKANLTQLSTHTDFDIPLARENIDNTLALFKELEQVFEALKHKAATVVSYTAKAPTEQMANLTRQHKSALDFGLKTVMQPIHQDTLEPGIMDHFLLCAAHIAEHIGSDSLMTIIGDFRPDLFEMQTP